MLKSRMLVSIICGALLSVAAYATPVEESHMGLVAVTGIAELPSESTVVTQADFIATMPYVVVLDTATPIPINPGQRPEMMTADMTATNFAVMLNLNFERTSNVKATA